MGDVIWVNFGERHQITVSDYLRSAAENERAAIDRPDLARPFRKLAEHRRRQAVELLMQGGGA